MRISSESFRVLSVLMWLALGSCLAGASDVYIAQSAPGSANGSNCSNAYAASFFNTTTNWGTGAGKIGPGITVHVCGTITGTANTTVLSFHGSGTSGNPITLLFELGAVVQAPYFASSVGGTTAGGISMGSGLSYLVVDGGTNGAVQNTANGSSLIYQRASTGVVGMNCSNCTVRNLTIANIYVNVSGDGKLGDNSVARALDITGSHWVVNNNTIHDCGWCLVEFYNNGDTDYQIYGNQIYNFGHGWALATSIIGAATTNIAFHDNYVHDTSNWDAPGCPFHQDGLHVFGVTGSSIAGFYFYNNYVWGNWGSCPTGMIYIEGGGLTNQYWWNNVFIVGLPAIENTNGWVGIFGSSGSEVVSFYDNTIIGPNANNNGLCLKITGNGALTANNNLIHNCGDPIYVDSSRPVAVDYNFYGANNGGNAFVWNDSFKGSLTNWRAACACDTHSVQNSSPQLNLDGSPQSTSPAVGTGANLTSIAAGALASLSSDTTRGNTRVATARPSNGSWASGAYSTPSGTTAPAPPAALTVAVH